MKEKGQEREGRGRMCKRAYVAHKTYFLSDPLQKSFLSHPDKTTASPVVSASILATTIATLLNTPCDSSEKMQIRSQSE